MYHLIIIFVVIVLIIIGICYFCYPKENYSSIIKFTPVVTSNNLIYQMGEPKNDIFSKEIPEYQQWLYDNRKIGTPKDILESSTIGVSQRPQSSDNPQPFVWF